MTSAADDSAIAERSASWDCSEAISRPPRRRCRSARERGLRAGELGRGALGGGGALGQLAAQLGRLGGGGPGRLDLLLRAGAILRARTPRPWRAGR